MRIEEVQSTTKKQRIATHTHIKGLGIAVRAGSPIASLGLSKRAAVLTGRGLHVSGRGTRGTQATPTDLRVCALRSSCIGGQSTGGARPQLAPCCGIPATSASPKALTQGLCCAPVQEDGTATPMAAGWVGQEQVSICARLCETPEASDG
jgi:hypothetical protein